MPEQQWARLIANVNVGLRRGAWYRVRDLGALEATLEVARGMVTVPRDLLDVATRPPTKWVPVARPTDAKRIPPTWGSTYVVCPRCRHRAPLSGRPARLRCGRCNGLFEVARQKPREAVRGT